MNKLKLLTQTNSPLTSPIISMIVGQDKRAFAAHADVLSVSPYFSAAIKERCTENGGKDLTLPEE